MVNVSEQLCSWISKLNIKNIFLVPGSQIDGLCHALVKSENITPVIACHELGAGFMAEGYARANETPAVCTSTGGPGASYMLSSAINARIESTPVLYITGSPPTGVYERAPFQDTGDQGTRDNAMYGQAIDSSFLLSIPNQLGNIIHEIDNLLALKRPSHLTLPYDLQFAQTPEYSIQNQTQCKGSKNAIIKQTASFIEKEIDERSRPVLLIGGSCLGEKNSRLLKLFSEKAGIPLSTTLSAKGVLPENHPLSLGNFGFAGNEQANEYILSSYCDLIIVMGTNFHQRENFNEAPELKNKRIILINHEPVVNKAFNNSIIHLTVPDYTLLLKDLLSRFDKPIKNRVIEVSPSDHNRKEIKFNLSGVLRELNRLVPENTNFVLDSGIHRIVAGAVWKPGKSNCFFSSDNQAPMGWAIGAAIGVQFSRKNSLVCVLTGDGCMRMHGMEIMTAVHYNLPILYIVANNFSYQSVANRSSSKEYRDTLTCLPQISWVEFGKSLGANGMTLTSLDQIKPLVESIQNTRTPFILEMDTSDDDSLNDINTLPDTLWPN